MNTDDQVFISLSFSHIAIFFYNLFLQPDAKNTIMLEIVLYLYKWKMKKIILLLSKGDTGAASFSNLYRVKCSRGRPASVKRINRSPGSYIPSPLYSLIRGLISAIALGTQTVSPADNEYVWEWRILSSTYNYLKMKLALLFELFALLFELFLF